MVMIPETLLARQKKVPTVHLTLGYQERIGEWKIRPARTDGWRMVSPFPSVLEAIAAEYTDYKVGPVRAARSADPKGDNKYEINFPPNAPPLTLVWASGDVNYVRRAPDGARAVIGNCDGEVLTPIQRTAPSMACPCNGNITCKPTISLQAEMVLPSHKKVLVGLESLSVNFIEELIPDLMQMESREETQRLILIVSVRNVDNAAWDMRANASSKQQFVRPLLNGAVWMDRQEYVDAIDTHTLPNAISRALTASITPAPVAKGAAPQHGDDPEPVSNIINYADHVAPLSNTDMTTDADTPIDTDDEAPEIDEMYLDPFASF